MLATIPIGTVVPTSTTKRFGLINRVSETVQILGDERGGLIPIKRVNGSRTPEFTLIKAGKLNDHSSTSNGTNGTSEMTPPDQNISTLWQYSRDLTETYGPETGDKTVYVTFDEKELINTSVDEPLKDSKSAELSIKDDGRMVALIKGNNMPLNFYEQLERLNWLLGNLPN